MKASKKSICILLTLVTVSGVLYGCGRNENTVLEGISVNSLDNQDGKNKTIPLPDLGYNRKTEISKFERLWSNIDGVWNQPYFIIALE